MNIVVLETLLGMQALEELGNVTFYDHTGYEQIVERTRDAEIVIINKCRMDASILAQLPKLKYIGILATGYNVVDLEAATRQGITVTNVPAYSTDSVAQMVWAHILNIVNRTGFYSHENRLGRWCRNRDFYYLEQPYMELAGKQMGIVGLGNIGMAVARIAQAFNMNVVAFTSKKEPGPGIRSVSLDELFSTSDIVSLHCPLTPSTEGMVDAARIRTMKPTAILINTGRGPLVNEHDLAEALKSGRIAAYGADVLSTEPAKSDNPLVPLPNCHLTPHIAWASAESQKRLVGICIDNVRSFLAGNTRNKVN